MVVVQLSISLVLMVLGSFHFVYKMIEGSDPDRLKLVVCLSVMIIYGFVAAVWARSYSGAQKDVNLTWLITGIVTGIGCDFVFMQLLVENMMQSPFLEALLVVRSSLFLLIVVLSAMIMGLILSLYLILLSIGVVRKKPFSQESI